MRTEDREKFVRLATRRVNNALKSINLLGNLSNRSNYDYTQQDVDKIFRALQAEIASCKKRFDSASSPSGKDTFSFD